MSAFPRIDPDHPLAEAARAVNAYAEEHGLERTLEWLGMDVGPGELAYLGEQRAMRAIAATIGVNLGADQAITETVAVGIQNTPLWRDMRMLLVSTWMDGAVTGWDARQRRRES